MFIMSLYFDHREVIGINGVSAVYLVDKKNNCKYPFKLQSIRSEPNALTGKYMFEVVDRDWAFFKYREVISAKSKLDELCNEVQRASRMANNENVLVGATFIKDLPDNIDIRRFF